jgi:hypothetical protein
MNIDIDLDYKTCQSSLLVEVEWPGGGRTLDLNHAESKLCIELDLPIKNQIIKLTFCCNDLDIVNHPMTVTNIVLDDFYSLPKILYSGVPTFDSMFLTYIKNNDILIDTKLTDINRLDFTGKLTYQFAWPFYKNVFQ